MFFTTAIAKAMIGLIYSSWVGDHIPGSLLCSIVHYFAPYVSLLKPKVLDPWQNKFAKKAKYDALTLNEPGNHPDFKAGFLNV